MIRPRRWLFALRSLEPDLVRHLASWKLSIVLMVLAAFYQLLLAVWSTSSPPHVVRNIAALLPFWLLYLLLLVNTAACLWRRLPALGRQLGSGPTLTARPPAWEAAAPGEESEGEALLRRLGYRIRWRSDAAVGGLRRRWAPLGTFLFHGAFFLVALGFLLSIAARRETTSWVAVGEPFEARPDQYLSVSAPRPLASEIPSVSFQVERIEPEFWRNELLFTTLEADLLFPDGGRHTTRINRPLWIGGSTFLRLSGFGYAPRYELTDPQGRVIESAFVKLNVFPPGVEDYFSPEGYPHRIYLQVMPDFGVEGGQPMTRTLNLSNPAAVARIHRGRLEVGRAVLRPSDSFAFEGLVLRLPEIRYWGEFSTVRDPGIPVLFLGYLAGLVGLLFKSFGARLEAEWVAHSGGGRIRGWGGPAPRRLDRPIDGESS